jgi:DNA integrity scanning protein DisA with diadenylate cyclase activity
VYTTGITDGQVLQYDLAPTGYVPHTLTTSSMTDIDNTGKTDGAVLLFDSASNKYKATTQLNNENTFMIGGSF